jgi:hypothetical protein
MSDRPLARHIAYLEALAISTLYPSARPLDARDGAALREAADAMRRLAGEAEGRGTKEVGRCDTRSK